MKTRPMQRPEPFVPTSAGGVGLLEKRETVVSTLQLEHSVSQVGDKNLYPIDLLELNQDVDWHNNHGNDLGTSTLNLTDSVTLVMDMTRSIVDTLSLSDYAHAILDGYHPPGTGNGSGDPDLSKHIMLAHVDMITGQPVYVYSNNTVSLAGCNPGVTDTDKVNVFALVLTGNTAGNDVEVLTEGSVERANWTSIVGTTYLVPGSVYYLDSTVGTLSVTAPTTDTYVVTRVGRAITTTKMDIEIGEVVVL